MIGTTAGVLVFLAFLLFATHLLLRLHAVSVVGAAAAEGARTVADGAVDRSDPVALARARAEGERRTRHLLGEAGREAELDWSSSTPETVALRVRLDVPDVLPAPLAMALPYDRVDRTVTVRAEELR
jgi:hypothetical protein